MNNLMSMLEDYKGNHDEHRLPREGKTKIPAQVKTVKNAVTGEVKNVGRHKSKKVD